jgi:transcription initiation factor TFIID subunit 2
MPSLEGEGSSSRAPPAPLGFSIEKQKIELDLDFAACSAKGKTTITISPQTHDLKFLRLDCRGLTISKLTVENKPVTVKYNDPYKKVRLAHGMGVHQHHFLKESIDEASAMTDESDLLIYLPKNFQIRVMDGYTALATHNMDLSSAAPESSKRRSTEGAETPAPKTAVDDAGSYYAPFTVYIEYELNNPRDGLYFAGVQEDDSRYPQAYTRSSALPGSACCWFPGLDNLGSRSSYEFHITTPRLLGDVFPELVTPLANGTGVNGTSHNQDVAMSGTEDSRFARLTPTERGLEMVVIGSGNLEDEIVNPKDVSRKTTSFKCDVPVTARHIGFAVGPFEHVDLSEFREDDEDEKLGASAVPVHGFCLPGRSEELTNVCMPVANVRNLLFPKYVPS